MTGVDRVFVCHAYAGDVARNVACVRKIVRQLFERGVTALAPHLYLPSVFSEAAERAAALAASAKLVACCQEIWYWGQITNGMRHEMKVARMRAMPVEQKIFLPDGGNHDCGA